MKQINGNVLIGGIISQAARAQFWVGFFNSFLVAAAAYKQVSIWLPWINFYMLIGFFIVINIIAGLVDYIMVMPAVVSYQMAQQAKHHNPQFELTQKIADKLGVKHDS